MVVSAPEYRFPYYRNLGFLRQEYPGRRNWLFAKSIRGADASAIVYSITETALLNGLKPYNYLTYILDEIRKMGVFPEPEEMDKLLLWSKDLPDEVRTKYKK